MAEDEARPPVDALEAGRDRLRDTIKWLIASFGAIAASLTLGSQLGNLGELEGARLAIGLVAALIAFGGVIAALAYGVNVLVGSYVSIGQLGIESARPPGQRRDELVDFFEQENPQYLGDHQTIAQLRDEYLRAFREESDQRQELKDRVSFLLNAASYERLNRNFARGLSRIIASVAIAAVAMVAFAWAATAKEKEPTPAAAAAMPAAVLAATPLPVLISPRPHTAALLKDELGPACNRSQLPALALRARGRAIEIVTLPTPRCRVARFIFGPEMGTVTPAHPACRVRRPQDQDVVLCNDIGA